MYTLKKNFQWGPSSYFAYVFSSRKQVWSKLPWRLIWNFKEMEKKLEVSAGGRTAAFPWDGVRKVGGCLGGKPGLQKGLHGKWKFEKAQQRHKYHVIWSHMFQAAHSKKARCMCKRNHRELFLRPRDQSLLSQGRRSSFIPGPYTILVFLQVFWLLRPLSPIIYNIYYYMYIRVITYGSFLLQRRQCEMNTVVIITAIFALEQTSK